MAKNAAYYMQQVPISTLLPINKGLTSANEPTMISFFGSPKVPLTTRCQNAKASPKVAALKVTQPVTSKFSLTGIKPAVDSVTAILKEVFQSEPDLEQHLSTEGMLCVRFRKPTSGAPSTKISNHSWGTTIDFKIKGHAAPGNTNPNVPRFVAVMLPVFNKHRWYSGVAFHDSMHFEASLQLIQDWEKNGDI